MRLSLLALACGAALFAPVSNGQAQVAMDASGMGLVIIGYDNRTCDSSIEGAIRYNSSTKKVEVCQLPTLNSCPLIGDTCSDGTVYGGISPDGNVLMYTTPADAASNYSYNDGVNSYTNTSMVDCEDETPGSAASCQTGAANTTYLLGATSEAGFPFAAAEYCAGLTVHGHSDWYLPAQDELDVLYNNRNAGDLDGTFDEGGTKPNGYYWSSSEYGLVYGRSQRFSDGRQDNNFTRKDDSHSVRCVRKSSTPPSPTLEWTNWGY